MVWGCMNWEGVGELTVVEGKMNSKHYHNIIYENMSKSIIKFGKEAEEWVFKHDNYQKHTSMSTFRRFDDNAIIKLP